MKKLAEILESEVDELLQDLNTRVSGEGGEIEDTGNYQVPVRHNSSGVDTDEDNKATILSTYTPKNTTPSHPQGHHGIDLQAPKGSPVYPIAPGTVIRIQSDSPKGGKTVNIAHEDGRVVSYYAHLDSIDVAKNQAVDHNTILGGVGNTGNASGTSDHLHYEVTVDGSRLDPQDVTGTRVGALSKKKDVVAQILNKLDSLVKI